MQAADLLPEHADFIRSMERTGALNRKVEFCRMMKKLKIACVFAKA